MFGRAPRGVSERPKITTTSKAIPSWLWMIFFILVAMLVLIYMSLVWQPWTPVHKAPSPTTNVVSKETNKDYRFYDLLPQQQVTPIPEQAVPEHQVKQAVVVVEAPAATTPATAQDVEDPFDGQVQTAQISAQPRYILQVRSFEDPDSADARRAEIVLNGLSAEVIMSNEGDKVWYRVISGPYESQDTAHIAQQTLQNGGIDSIIVKQP